ncbi:MAG: sulfur carrier protein ThiS [Bacteroidales bacterium]
MQIFLNDKILETENQISLSRFLETQHIHAQKGVAVAVNLEIITQGQWDQKILQENDKLTLIGAYYGG